MLWVVRVIGWCRFPRSSTDLYRLDMRAQLAHTWQIVTSELGAKEIFRVAAVGGPVTILGQEEANNVCFRRLATSWITEVIPCMTRTGPQRDRWVFKLDRSTNRTPADTLQSEGFATRGRSD